MQSKPKPYLRLVWPQPVVVEPLDDCSSTLAKVLESEGWLSVSTEDLQRLPPDTACLVRAYKVANRWETYMKTLPKVGV